MAKTRTPGITVLADGRLFIDKRRLGLRIGLRVGAITQEQAEERLRVEIARIEYERERKAHARPTFADGAARYVAQSHGKRSIDVIKWDVQLLARYIGSLEPRQVHGATLEPFIQERLIQGAIALSDQPGGAGQALSPAADSRRPHGAIRDQHGVAAAQPVRLAMDVESSGTRNSQERVRHPPSRSRPSDLMS